jgi:hypothetical protein
VPTRRNPLTAERSVEGAPDIPGKLDAVVLALKKARSSNNRRTAMTAVAIGLFAVVAVLASVLAWNVHRDFERFLDSRSEARIVACEDDNAARLVDIQQIISASSPERIAEIETDPARLNAALGYLRPVRGLRVCTPEAIDAYYDSHRVEGVEPPPWPPYIAEFLARHTAEDPAAGAATAG